MLLVSNFLDFKFPRFEAFALLCSVEPYDQDLLTVTHSALILKQIQCEDWVGTVIRATVLNVLIMDNSSFRQCLCIGRNKTHVLNNNDEIALSHKKNKAFIFHDPTCVNSHDMPEVSIPSVVITVGPYTV